MDRSSIDVWIAARHNVPGLPECPSFLSEPALVDLLFCERCHVGLFCLDCHARFIVLHTSELPEVARQEFCVVVPRSLLRQLCLENVYYPLAFLSSLPPTERDLLGQQT